MAEAVKVIVRCRPLNQREKDLKCQVVLEMDGNTGLCSLNKPGDKTQPPKNFTFDGAYYIDATTEGIYNDICFPLVEGVLEGYNGTVFAYGQTGCGKSFSMQGITDPPSQRGIIPRAFEHIFESVEVSENSKFLIHASYLEIYNEEIRDLLGKDHKVKLELKEHPDRGVYVKDLSMHPVHSSSEIEHVMDLGSKNRSVGATLMNADSSRSHSIFSIFIEILDTAPDGSEHIRAGKLNLVDLAGSERQSKTGATGDRLKEATKINLSLSALGNVISALVDGKAKHIPYRDSKLTRLLQDSLGGNTKTLMVACLSPADNNYDETLSTLRYANRAKNIKNKPKINEDPKDALLREYKEEIEKLKKMLMGQMDIPSGMLGEGASSNASVPKKSISRQLSQEHTLAVKAETETLRQEYEAKIADMKMKYEAEQMSKQKLQAEMDRLKGDYSRKVHDIEEHYAIEEGLTENEDSVGGVTSVTPDTSSVMSVIALEEARRASDAQANIHDPSLLHMLQDKMHKGMENLHHSSNAALHMIQEKVNKANLPSAMVDSQGVQHEALKRLQELQEKMVGGEKKGDQKLKEKRKARKAYAKSRKEKLFIAAKKMDDEGISTMVQVYDSLQDEIKFKTKHIDRLEKQLASTKADVDDLQEEFERDREDYLDTIRKQEQMLKLQQQILDKIQPCIRRDCNYYNLDRVKNECSWDEESGKWNIPDLIVTKTTLPNPGGIMPGASPQIRRKSPTGRPQMGPQGHQMNGYSGGSHHEEPKEDRFLQHLSRNSHEEFAANYFKPKRAEKLLSQNSRFDGIDRRETSPVGPRQTASFAAAPPPRSFGSTQHPPPQDAPLTRPLRLESLNMPIEKEKKKKKKKQAHVDLAFERRRDEPW